MKSNWKKCKRLIVAAFYGQRNVLLSYLEKNSKNAKNKFCLFWIDSWYFDNFENVCKNGFSISVKMKDCWIPISCLFTIPIVCLFQKLKFLCLFLFSDFSKIHCFFVWTSKVSNIESVERRKCRTSKVSNVEWFERRMIQTVRFANQGWFYFRQC